VEQASTARTRVRGTTLLRAPIVLVAVVATSVALLTALWGAWEGNQRAGAFWATLAVAAGIGVAGFVAAAGCFVEVTDTEVRDVIAWVTVHRVPRQRIDTALVARGMWRWFVLRLDDGTTVTLVGASPAQFPARLLPDARTGDLADLHAMVPDDRDADAAGGTDGVDGAA
jgi:hypothetical protein